jgi:hypothetical protein
MKFIANGFTTDLPDNWQDRSMITLVGPPRDGFAPNAVVMRQPVGPRVSIEDYAQEQGQAARAEIPGLEIIDERPARVNGCPAFQRLQRFSAQGRMLQQAQTFILGNGMIFVITCTATLEHFNDSIPTFRRFVDAFQISGG